MDDALTRALEETTEPNDEPNGTLVERTAHPRSVHDLLDMLRSQALEAVRLPFFDGDVHADLVPIRTVGRAETGALQITARRCDPAYVAAMTLDVRCDRESNNSARYEVHGNCVMSSEANAALYQREFGVPTTLHEDGSLQIDIDHLRAEMAAAIKSIGKI